MDNYEWVMQTDSPVPQDYNRRSEAHAANLNAIVNVNLPTVTTDMSSTTMATLSLKVQPEHSNLGQQEIQPASKIGYQKVDIDLVKQQETKPASDAKRQPNGIANGNTPLPNGTGKENPTNDIETSKSEKSGSKLESETNGVAANQYPQDDQFHRLPKPQQEILLLHGPGQRYRLEKAREIPELKSDQELLVQVGKNRGNGKPC